MAYLFRPRFGPPYLFPLDRTFFALVASIGPKGLPPRLPGREGTPSMHLLSTFKESSAVRTNKRKSISSVHNGDDASRYRYSFELRGSDFVKWCCQYVGNVDITRSI